jgi:hypothetical protein
MATNPLAYTPLGPLFDMETEEDRESAAQLKALQELYENASAPNIGPVNYTKQEYQGDVPVHKVDAGADVNYKDIQAALADVVTQGDSEMKGVSTDPRLREAQMAALSQLQEIADGGGRTAQDDANLARIQGQTAQADRGRRDAIKQNMAARGMGGSGMELLAQLQSNQAATDRQAQEGLDIAGMAQQRALEAMMHGGQLGGSIRGQDFGEQSAIAQAQDRINQFNASTQNQGNQFNASTLNSTNQFNTGNRLQTDMYNRNINYDANKTNASALNTGAMRDANVRQGVSDANTGISNQQTHQNQIVNPQQNFQNQETIRQGQAGGNQAAINYHQNQRRQKTDQFGQLVGGAATIGSGFIAKSDERAKKDVVKVDGMDIDAFLKSLEPKKFEYKSKKDGQGKHTGVMAQDLLKTTLGSEAVVETEDGDLGYDTQKMQGITLAALKHLSDKIDEKE